MTDPHAIIEGLTEKTARNLRVISAAMGSGIAAFALFVAWAYLSPGDTVVTPNGARLINILTMTVMAWSLAAIALGEFLWRRQLRRIERPADADAAAQAAFIVRLALREGTALLGLVVCFLAARNGVLRAYPAYWVDAAPAALFLFFLWARWPSLENLRAQVKDALASA